MEIIKDEWHFTYSNVFIPKRHGKFGGKLCITILPVNKTMEPLLFCLAAMMIMVRIPRGIKTGQIF